MTPLDDSVEIADRSAIPATRFFTFRKAALAVGGLALTMAGLLPAVSAVAEQPSTLGKVVSKGSLTVRSLPDQSGSNRGSESRGSQLELNCKVRGQTVNGNSLWYRLPDQAPAVADFVPGRYVANIGRAPLWCENKKGVGKAVTAVRLRTSPTRTASTVGTLKAGARITVLCKINGPTMGGNPRWYFTSSHRWIPARYISNVGKAPGYCGADS